MISAANNSELKGIETCKIENNNLVIYYTDGNSENIGRVVGADGVNGTNGKSYIPTIGTVSTLSSGQNATVSVKVQGNKAIFDFGIPKGVDGVGGSSESGSTNSYYGCDKTPVKVGTWIDGKDIYRWVKKFTLGQQAEVLDKDLVLPEGYSIDVVVNSNIFVDSNDNAFHGNSYFMDMIPYTANGNQKAGNSVAQEFVNRSYAYRIVKDGRIIGWT